MNFCRGAPVATCHIYVVAHLTWDGKSLGQSAPLRVWVVKKLLGTSYRSTEGRAAKAQAVTPGPLP